MFWAFIAALSTGIVSFTGGFLLSHCGICCPKGRNNSYSNRNETVNGDNIRYQSIHPSAPAAAPASGVECNQCFQFVNVLDPTQLVIHPVCGHSFHSQCFHILISNNQGCPTCARTTGIKK